jgi:hypothetical protein
VKNLTTYQQIVVYFMPLLGQLQFINLVVVLVRLYWFKNKFKDIGITPPFPLSPHGHNSHLIWSFRRREEVFLLKSVL